MTKAKSFLKEIDYSKKEIEDFIDLAMQFKN